MRTLVLVAAGLIAFVGGARGQSTTSIQRYLAEQNKDCSIYAYQEKFRGTVPGIAQPVTVAAYTLESCGGGNTYSRTVGVFYGSDSKVERFKAPQIEGPSVDDRNGVAVRGDRLIVRSLTYAPNDARCCPTVKRTMTYRLTDGVVVPAQ